MAFIPAAGWVASPLGGILAGFLGHSVVLKTASNVPRELPHATSISATVGAVALLKGGAIVSRVAERTGHASAVDVAFYAGLIGAVLTVGLVIGRARGLATVKAELPSGR